MHKGIENLNQFLSRHEKFIISTHESPDGDGLGAEIAFQELIRGLGKTSMILNSDPTPDKYLFMDRDGEINIFRDGSCLPPDLDEYATFVLDTNEFSNIGAAYHHLENRVQEVFIIDHHEGGDDKFEANYIKAEASSVCEIIYDIITSFGSEPSFKAAQAIYAGILFDTGSFRYPKTTSDTFRVISRLVELGASPFKIYEEIYENNSLESFELRGLMFSTMETHFGGRLVLLKLTPAMLAKSQAPFTEGELNINLPLTVKGVVASLLVKQDVEGPVKVSMRTKGDYNVAAIAMANGGGGHKNAAGYKSRLSFEETCRKALKDMEQFFP